MSSTTRKRAASTAEASSSKGPRGKKQRLPDTCEWILREPAYRSWKNSNEGVSPVLWIHGPPGCGKTFLAQFILDDVQQEAAGSGTLAYFCDANSSPTSVIRSLLLQLLQFPELGNETKAIVTEAASEVSPGDHSPPLDAAHRLWDTLSSVLPNLHNSTLVVDGVDEISGNHLQQSNFDLPSKLVELTEMNDTSTKLLLSSRSESIIQRSMRDSPDILVTSTLVNEDLERFIQSEVMEYQELDAWRDVVGTSVLARSEGSFVWAALAIKSLATEAPVSASAEDGSQFLERMDNIPASLDDLYCSVFAKQATSLTAGQVLLRDQILRWILFVARPLSLNELANAIAIESNAFITDLEAQAIEACGSLIKVENGIVKPVHHSLRDFLSNPEHAARDKILSVRPESSNLIIAKSLLAYLSHPSFASIEESLGGVHFLSTHPLIEYATLYWVYHASSAARDSGLQSLISQFFANSTNWIEWSDKLLPHFLPLSTLPIPPRPFHTARFLHLFALKGQLTSYLAEEERATFAKSFEDSLQLAYENFVAQAQFKSGPESLEVAQRLLDLAEVYSWIAKSKSRSLAQVQAASFIISKHTGSDAESLSITVHQTLADEYKRAGKYNDAHKILESLISNDHLPSTDPRRMFALDALGWVNMRLGNLEAAEARLEQAKDLAAQIFGHTSPVTLRSKVTLAEVLGKLGRYEEAEALCAELKEQLRQHRDYGVPLPKDSISQLHLLAMVFMQEGKLKDAMDTYQIVVDDRRKIFGDEHGMTLGPEMQLGIIKEKLGDLEGAKQVFMNVLPRQEKVLGVNHPDVIDVKRRLEEFSSRG